MKVTEAEINESKARSQQKLLARQNKAKEDKGLLSIYHDNTKVRWKYMDPLMVVISKDKQETNGKVSYQVTATVRSFKDEPNIREAKLICAKRLKNFERTKIVSYPIEYLTKDVLILEYEKIKNEIIYGNSIFDPYKRNDYRVIY